MLFDSEIILALDLVHHIFPHLKVMTQLVTNYDLIKSLKANYHASANIRKIDSVSNSLHKEYLKCDVVFSQLG